MQTNNALAILLACAHSGTAIPNVCERNITSPVGNGSIPVACDETTLTFIRVSDCNTYSGLVIVPQSFSVAKTRRMPKVAGHVSPKGPFGGAKEPLIIGLFCPKGAFRRK